MKEEHPQHIDGNGENGRGKGKGKGKGKEDSFSAQWLALREPADHAARSRTLTRRLSDWCANQGNLRILDLGTGTASNLRYLCPHLGHEQHWTLLDHDRRLLDSLPGILQSWSDERGYDLHIDKDAMTLSASDFSARLQWQRADLSAQLEHLEFERTHLVTASALLDLTSESWLRALTHTCIAQQCASLFVLNYNGQVRWHPELEDDAFITTQLNAHQRRDKGFGPALGPQASEFLCRCLQDRQQLHTEASHWQITAEPSMRALTNELATGWASAACELNAADQQRCQSWLRARRQLFEQGSGHLSVGHTDVLSLPL